jgi:HK97 family phage major capsid protein
MNLQQLLAKRAELMARLNALRQMGETRGGRMTDEERTQFDGLATEIETLDGDIERAKRAERLAGVPDAPLRPAAEVPMINRKTKLGDDESKALAYYIRTADAGALNEVRASNNTGMNVTTAADGGNAVPTGHFQGIIARRDEMMLRDKLGCMEIPGKGLTVNVPVDAEADGEFVTTSEMGDDNTTNVFDRDAPALGTVAMTLVKKTKKIEITDELLEDEDSRLLAFIENFIGRGMAKTHNLMLTTEALASGTAALTFDAAATIASAEVPELYYKLEDEYASDTTTAWLMRRATEGIIRGQKGDPWHFAPTPNGDGMTKTLWDMTPVYNAASMPAVAASAKSLLVGNFAFMAYREGPGFSFLRDPYTVDGKVILKYYFRTVYKVTQAEAFVYGSHPSA